MTVGQTLLVIVAGMAFIGGAIILTPLGIIIGAFVIYIWNILYPLLLRIGRWSAQWRNFVPILILAVIIGVVIFFVGLIVYGAFGFSGLSILLFIWLFLLWLLLFGLAALPIGLAIVIWVVRGVRWLWPRYRDSLWSTVPLVGGGMLTASKRLESQADQARGYTQSLGLDKRLQEGATRAREYARSLALEKRLREMSKLLEESTATARGLAEKAEKTSRATIINPLRRLFRRK